MRDHAHLVLQGPEGKYRSEMIALAADDLGLTKNGSVSFPDAVDTRDLISTASQADLGIIPYAPSSLNNRYCCPNKLSQYMAAGLPILCNETEFVKEVVVGNGLGFCLNFSDKSAMANTINNLSRNEELREISRRSRNYFDQEFHWENMSGELNSKI